MQLGTHERVLCSSTNLWHVRKIVNVCFLSFCRILKNFNLTVNKFYDNLCLFESVPAVSFKIISKNVFLSRYIVHMIRFATYANPHTHLRG